MADKIVRSVDISVPQVVGQLCVFAQDFKRTVEQVSRRSGDADRETVGGCADNVFNREACSGLSCRSLTSQFRRLGRNSCKFQGFPRRPGATAISVAEKIGESYKP